MNNSKKLKKIELLAPAGDLERLKTAIVFGADAVYCGLPSWSLRNAREITFTLKTLKEGIKFAHERGAKLYITFNVFAHEAQLKKAEEDLKKMKDLDIDGIIVSDLGMLALVKKHLPKVSIHISTQANTVNSEAVQSWNKLGADRIVLARELTLKEIAEIKKKNPKVELEVFGHGAMCIAYSGRCLLSKYFTNREANLGDCAQSCRWRYKLKVKSEKLNVEEPLRDKFYIEEETRPGELLGIEEDEKGTYIMNSKEICSIDILDKFIESGIDSLKIEGRAKTVYYLATIVRAYRKAIDAYYEKERKIRNLKIKKLDKKKIEKDFSVLISELEKELSLVQNRGYSHGFLTGRHDYEQEYDIAAFKPAIAFLGVVCGSKKDLVEIEVKNKFKTGDKVELVTPNGILKTKILEIIDKKGAKAEEALTPQERFLIKFDIRNKVPERSILRKKLK